MTSHDVRDMLDLPGSAAPRPTKKQKTAGPRPNLKGLAREVQSLGGDNPIAIVPDVSIFKKRRLASRKPAAKWELKPFKNSARNDNLILRHWRRQTETAPAVAAAAEETNGEPAEVPAEPELDDSVFAKFNVRVNIPTYDDEQYKAKLENEDWSKGETDYLMGLIQEYDLRWPVIWDRYEYEPPIPEVEAAEGTIAIIPATKDRSMEDLKARYYFVAAKMMAVNNPVQFMGQAEFSLHETMMNFNPAQETARKKFAEAALNRTKEEAREEESLLLELKRMMARTEKLNEERNELYARLETPPSTGNIAPYTSSQGLASLLQQLMTADKSKKRKSLLGPEGISPAGPSSQQSSAFDRRDSTNRDSNAGSSTVTAATNNKKGGQGPTERRKLTEEEERVYGVTHHERLTSGPSFRHEKINRFINGKSSGQQLKIINTLTELEVPQRLIMPTAVVGAAFESLLHNINVMLDAKKVADKLATEIALATAQKAEREKREKEKRGEVGENGENGENDETGEAGDAEVGDQEAEESRNVKVEEGEKEKSVPPSTRAGSVHKRSASVLSTLSDQSTKRQKK